MCGSSSTPLLIQLLFWFNIGDLTRRSVSVFRSVRSPSPSRRATCSVRPSPYIAVTSVLSASLYYIERHYARGDSRVLPPTPPQPLRRHLSAVRTRLAARTAADAR